MAQAGGDDPDQHLPAAGLGELVEALEFPEAIGNELTLRRALDTLVERALIEPDRTSSNLIEPDRTAARSGRDRRRCELRQYQAR